MFGFVAADPTKLSPEETEIYRGAYCGLCHALNLRHGSLARLTLNYDMTFLVLLLSSIYKVGFERCEKKCPVHPFKKQILLHNEITDYAADMNIALSYKNLLDDWQDDKSPGALIASMVLAREYNIVYSKYPRQCGAIDACLGRLSETEKRGEPDPDCAAAIFGELMAELFIWQEDALSGRLRNFGTALGRVIYIMDAATDLRKDLKKQRYNPLAFVPDLCKETVLDALMSRCTDAYEALGAADNRGIFDNIMYCGIWMKYEASQSGKSKGRRQL